MEEVLWMIEEKFHLQQPCAARAAPDPKVPTRAQEANPGLVGCKARRTVTCSNNSLCWTPGHAQKRLGLQRPSEAVLLVSF